MTGPRTLAEHIVPSLTGAAERAGRSYPRVIACLPVCVTSDETAARAEAARAFEMYGYLPSYRAMLDREGVDGPADVAIVGTEAEVSERIASLGETGVTEFVAVQYTSDDRTPAPRPAPFCPGWPEVEPSGRAPERDPRRPRRLRAVGALPPVLPHPRRGLRGRDHRPSDPVDLRPHGRHRDLPRILAAGDRTRRGPLEDDPRRGGRCSPVAELVHLRVGGDPRSGHRCLARVLHQSHRDGHARSRGAG